MKVDKQKILTQIIDYLNHNFDLTPKSLIKKRGYYLWDFGDDSTIHVEFKEIKSWKFGIWILTSDESEKDEIVIEFFGNKKNWIDKFKPTCSKISSEVKITSKDIDDPDDYLWDLFYSIRQDLNGLRRHRFLWEYFLDSEGEDHFIKWLIDEIWYGTIRANWLKFYEAKVLIPLSRLFMKFLKYRFYKYISDIKFEDTHEVYFHQPCNIYISYSSDINASGYVHQKIQKNPIFKFLNLTSSSIGSVVVYHIKQNEPRQVYYINRGFEIDF